MRGSSKTTAAWFPARNGGIHFLPMVGHGHMFSILHVPCWMIARGSSFRYLTKLPESLSFHNWSAVCLKLENNGLNQNLQWLSILARATGIGVDRGVGRLCVVHQLCGEIAGGIPKSHQFLHLSCLGLSSHGLTVLAPCVEPLRITVGYPNLAKRSTGRYVYEAVREKNTLELSRINGTVSPIPSSSHWFNILTIGKQLWHDRVSFFFSKDACKLPQKALN